MKDMLSSHYINAPGFAGFDFINEIPIHSSHEEQSYV